MAKKKFDLDAFCSGPDNWASNDEDLGKTKEQLVEDLAVKYAGTKIPVYREALPIDELYDYLDKDGNGQPFRVNPDDVKTLAASIRENGVLEPLIVTKMDGRDGYMIISGHTRTAAARMAGLTTIPAVIRTYDSDEQAEKAMLDSNVRRKKLYPTDMCAVFKRWMAIRMERGLTVQEVADKFGVSQTTLNIYLEIEDCLPEIRAAIDDDRIDIGVIHSIAVMKKEDQQEFIDDCLSQEEHVTKKEMTEFVSSHTKAKKAASAGLSDDAAPFVEKPFVPAAEEDPVPETESEAPAAVRKEEDEFPDELPVQREEEFDAYSAAMERMKDMKALTLFSVSYFYGDEDHTGYFLSMSLRRSEEVSERLSELYGEDMMIENIRRIGSMEVNEAVEDCLVSTVAAL